VIGSDNEIGRPVSDGVGCVVVEEDVDDDDVDDLMGVDEVTDDTDGFEDDDGLVGVDDDGLVGVGDEEVDGDVDECGGKVGTVRCGAVVVVVAAPTGDRPVNTLAATMTRPPATTAIEERGFRLKVLLLFFCVWATQTRFEPATRVFIPVLRTTKQPWPLAKFEINPRNSLHRRCKRRFLCAWGPTQV
jgi:hypothetical protein